MVFPVFVGELEILDRIRLDVDGKVGEVAESMDDTEDKMRMPTILWR